jgi:hypothetical protein
MLLMSFVNVNDQLAGPAATIETVANSSYHSNSLNVLNLTFLLGSVWEDPRTATEINELRYASLWSAEHSERVATGVGALAIASGEDFRSARLAVTAAVLHDIGKADPQVHNIVDYPGKYDVKQRTQMKLHVPIGMQKAKQAGFSHNTVQLMGCVHAVFNRMPDPYPLNFVLEPRFFESTLAPDLETYVEVLAATEGHSDGQFSHNRRSKPNLEKLAAILVLWDYFDARQSQRPERPDHIEKRETTMQSLNHYYTGNVSVLEQFDALTRPRRL